MCQHTDIDVDNFQQYISYYPLHQNEIQSSTEYKVRWDWGSFNDQSWLLKQITKNLCQFHQYYLSVFHYMKLLTDNIDENISKVCKQQIIKINVKKKFYLLWISKAFKTLKLCLKEGWNFFLVKIKNYDLCPSNG